VFRPTLTFPESRSFAVVTLYADRVRVDIEDMNLTTRELTIDDYEDLTALWDRAGLLHKPKGRESRSCLGRELNLPHCLALGLFDCDRLLGAGIANWDGRRGWINRLAVHPDFRGLGLAGRLLEPLEEFLRKQGALVICALIEEENEPSMTCFEKAGFVCSPEVKYFSKRSSEDD